MGTRSPNTTPYLSPQRCGLWPNEDVICNFPKRRSFNKPLSPKAAKEDRKLGESRSSDSLFQNTRFLSTY